MFAAKYELGFKREGVELKRIYVVIEHNVFGANEFDHVLRYDGCLDQGLLL